MPPDIKNFRELVVWLVREHHKGVWYDMAKKLQVSSGLVYQWRDGTVKRPSDENIEALCRIYKLDYWKLMAIIHGRKPPSVAMWIAAIGLALLSASAQARPLSVPPIAVDEAHYVNLFGGRRRRMTTRWPALLTDWLALAAA